MKENSTHFLLVISFLLSSLTLLHEAKADILLEIRESAGVERTSEMVHNGIPVAERDNITSTDSLIIEDLNGVQVPATFEVLSRWAGGKDDSTRPIQWLLVSFPATVGAGGAADYILRTGTPVNRTRRVTVTETSSSYSVDTGAAQFVINKNRCTLFDSISRDGQVLASGNGGSHSTIEGQAEAVANLPLYFEIERQNDHYAVIKVEVIMRTPRLELHQIPPLCPTKSAMNFMPVRRQRLSTTSSFGQEAGMTPRMAVRLMTIILP